MSVTVRFDPTATSQQAVVIPNATPANDGVMTRAQAAKLASLTPSTPPTAAQVSYDDTLVLPITGATNVQAFADFVKASGALNSEPFTKQINAGATADFFLPLPPSTGWLFVIVYYMQGLTDNKMASGRFKSLVSIDGADALTIANATTEQQATGGFTQPTITATDGGGGLWHLAITNPIGNGETVQFGMTLTEYEPVFGQPF